MKKTLVALAVGGLATVAACSQSPAPTASSESSSAGGAAVETADAPVPTPVAAPSESALEASPAEDPLTQYLDLIRTTEMYDAHSDSTLIGQGEAICAEYGGNGDPGYLWESYFEYIRYPLMNDGIEGDDAAIQQRIDDLRVTHEAAVTYICPDETEHLQPVLDTYLTWEAYEAYRAG